MAKKAVATVIEDPVETARAEVDRLNGAELRFAMLYRSKAEELAGERAKRGDQVLDAANPEGAARDVGQRASAMREELESLADASRRARERRVQAIPAVFNAEADAAERAAAQLEAEATELEAESRRLRKVLEAFDDCLYSPTTPMMPGALGGGGGAPLIVEVRVPRYERLRLAARDKRSEAARTRLKKAHQAGGLTAATIEDLIATVHADPMRVGPPIDAIVTWSEQAIENERRRRERVVSTEDGFTAPDAPMRLYLEWRNGVIDVAGSGLVQPELIQVEPFADVSPAAAAPTVPSAKDPRMRTPLGTTPYYTGPTLLELTREAANTEQSIEEIAKAWGVPVPKPVQGEAV